MSAIPKGNLYAENRRLRKKVEDLEGEIAVLKGLLVAATSTPRVPPHSPFYAIPVYPVYPTEPGFPPVTCKTPSS